MMAAPTPDSRPQGALGDDCLGQSSVAACLCCACGTVALERDWTYWKRDEEGENWIPVEHGDTDPMALCPACKWEHQDTDDGSGYYQGTLAEMEAQREADLPEYADWWADRLAEVAHE